MRRQSGFGAIAVIAVIVVVATLGLVGWRVLSVHREEAEAPAPAQSNASSAENSKPSKNEQSLANGKVTFAAPKDWSVTLTDGGRRTVTSTAIESEGKSGAILAPAGKVLNSYNEPFTVSVSVFKKTKTESPQEWFEQEMGESLATPEDKTSKESINGYSTYIFEQINNSYHEYHYVLYHNGLFVHVSWRPDETHYTNDAIDQHVDNNKYNETIIGIVKSIRIE